MLSMNSFFGGGTKDIQVLILFVDDFHILNIDTSVASIPAFGILVVCCLQIRGTKLG